MLTIFSCRCLVVLVYGHLCWKLSEGAVFPCYKKDTQFRNRTLKAGMGGTVSFTFCAENSVRVFKRINISHPNHRHGWYPQRVGVLERLQVNVIIHHRWALVQVRVTKLQPADFNGAFFITLFAADEKGTRINDSSTFFFVIKETDLRSTTTRCDEQSEVSPSLTICRVIDDICLVVFGGSRNMTPMAQCAAENTSHIADFNSIDILKPCLTYLLLYNPVTIVRLDEARYIDIQNWTEVRPRWPYRVACLLAKHQLADPVITWFTLQRWDDQRETILWEDNLLDGNNTSVVIPATNTTLNVTCQASGYPKPQIVILRDNETLEVFPDGVSLQLSHTFYGELICQATNDLTSRQTHIRVLVSAPDSTSGNSSQSETAAWKIGVTAGVLAVAPTIVVVVLLCVFFKKKGVVVDNMALYNLGNNEVTVDNSVLYNMDKKSIDDTDSVNPYEDINDSTINYEDTTTSKSPQKELGEYSNSHACSAESQESTDGANVHFLLCGDQSGQTSWCRGYFL